MSQTVTPAVPPAEIYDRYTLSGIIASEWDLDFTTPES